MTKRGLNLEDLETFVMKAIENGYVQGHFKTEDGMRAVQKVIAYRFALGDKL